MDTRLFKNCLEVRKTAEGLLPLRFTDAQLAVYARNPNWGVRSLCPAGILIDALTDAKGVSIEYKFHGRARDYHRTDVCVDGLLYGSHGSQSAVSEFRFRQELPPSAGKPRRVTLHLPYTSHIVVTHLEFHGASSVEPAPATKKKLLFLGDSITQGMDAQHPSCIYATLLSHFLGMDALNQGVGGYGFNPESLDPALPYKPDLIIVAYGSNDWFHNASPEEVRESCDEYMQKTVSLFPGKPVVAITPIWRLDFTEKRPAGTFMQMVETIESVNAGLPQVKTLRGLNLLPHLTSLMGDSRVHPSDEGFLHMALNLAGEIKNLGLAG